MAGEERDRLRRRLRELLIEARKRAGMTQTELAKALGRPQSFVSNYERGERRVEVGDFILICQALKAEATNLLSEIRNSQR